jgi:hypothetical protein
MRPTASHLLLVSGAYLLPAAVTPAQIPSPAAARVAAMRQVNILVGEWRGSGWSTAGTGQRIEFELVETVTRTVGGTVLLIEGHGTATDRNGKEVVTHDGLALLYYDEKTRQYRWHGHELSSGVIDAEARLVDRGLEWSFRAGEPGATVRFTITFDEALWHEVGEVSTGGQTWNRFMEMTLARVTR